jgi:hypothetical protein
MLEEFTKSEEFGVNILRNPPIQFITPDGVTTDLDCALPDTGAFVGSRHNLLPPVFLDDVILYLFHGKKY